MKTWHETMMLSSDSFRECHENRGTGTGTTEPTPAPLVNDYISITNQGSGQYWSMYDTDKGIEEGKTYHVIINKNDYVLECVMGSTHPELQGNGLDLKYNKSLERYLITFYPSEYDIGSNPTVYFKIEEVKYDYNVIKLHSTPSGDIDAIIVNGVSYPCTAMVNLDSIYINNLGNTINIFTAEFLHNAVYKDGNSVCKSVSYVPHDYMYIYNSGVSSYLKFNR